MTSFYQGIKWGAYVVGIILAIDFICFLFWIASGQTPPTGFYFGTVTAHIIRLFIH